MIWQVLNYRGDVQFESSDVVEAYRFFSVFRSGDNWASIRRLGVCGVSV